MDDIHETIVEENNSTIIKDVADPENLLQKWKPKRNRKVSIKKNNVKRKTCKICPEVSFSSEEEYILHVRDVHEGKMIVHFMCSECGKQFKTKSELTHHINSKCGTIKQFKCNVCNQNLMTAGSLHNHMLRHSGVRRYMCRFCAKLFLTAGQLKVHERIHTHDKAFVCDVCEKGFCHRQSLITHSTVHTGIKPFQCENCGNSFSCIGNLLKHRRTHPDTCGMIPLTTHTVKHPPTKLKVKINTPATSRLKIKDKQKEMEEKIAAIEARLKTEASSENSNISVSDKQEICTASEITKNVESGRNILKDEPKILMNEYVKYTTEQEDFRYNSDDLNNDGFLPPSDDSCDIETVKIEENREENFNEHTEATKESQNDRKVKTKLKTEITINDEHTEATKESQNDTKVKTKHKTGITIKSPVSKKEVAKFIEERGLTQKQNMLCKYCNKLYTHAGCLLKHEQSHVGNSSNLEASTKGSFKCSCCKALFLSKDECIVHQQNMHADILTCHDCDKIFANVDSLRSHQNIFHKGIPRKVYLYVCEKCGKQFKQKKLLKHHEDNNCSNSPLSQCKICQKEFSTVHARRTHMRIHNSEKKLLCKFCGKRFHWKGQLKIHERSHTGEKPFTCLYCPKAFAYRESLITHSSLHTGIKPHLCEACGSRFSCIGNLLKHRVAHSNTCGLWYEKNRR